MRKRKARSVIFVSRTDEFNVYDALAKALRYLKVRLSFKIAAVKVNLCALKLRETGATSDPVVVEQLVKLLNDNSVHVRLVESDSTNKDADVAFKYLGFKDLERKYDVKCINLSKDEYSIRKVDGYRLRSIKMPRALETAEFFITHPKLKTHSSMKVHLTGALKNQFGCLTRSDKSIYHPDIHEIIADINRVFAPDLTIMDAITAMTGYGPTDGIPQRLNLLLTSRDPVAVDALGARIFRYDPASIKYIRLASGSGIGNIDSTLRGDPVRNLVFDMHVNKFILRSFEVLSSVGIGGDVEA